MLNVTLNRQYELHKQVQEHQHEGQVKEKLEIPAPCETSSYHTARAATHPSNTYGVSD